IAAKGIYRDPVRSSDAHFVKASGLRWLSLMLVVDIPWAQRVWALPFFTVLAPSERYNQQRNHRHKYLIDWARQMLKQVRRWLPHRALVVTAESCFAALEMLSALSSLSSAVHMVTRLRFDAALYEPAAPRLPHQMGRPRLKGKRLPTLATRLQDGGTTWQQASLKGWYGGQQTQLELVCGTAVWYHTGLPPVPIRWVLVRDPAAHFEPQAFLCTDLTASPEQILLWFRQR
ncbi:MAG TPA: transposase, partial [Candidatus Caenarcaniphilales bacterium]